MTGEEQVEVILDDFRRWLHEAQSAGADLRDSHESPSAPVGLGDVVEAFTALRHELKLQTKSARGLQEQAASAIGAMQQAAAALAEAPKSPSPSDGDGRRIAAALANLHEALERGARAIAAAREALGRTLADQVASALEEEYRRLPAWRRWAARPWRDKAAAACRRHAAQASSEAFDNLADGFAMIQARLARAMEEQLVERISCVGRPADPHAMTVVAVVDDPDRPAGEVVEEVRPGYRWNGEVLRFAEVAAVRQNP
ncbi:MAG: nucleotide exchange factor GrpE [Planctomycetes bacterium]|nr:nucleotide exchange factor GrpE [Planctomycetota bacterium]